jgi:N-acetyl-gamma-glutamyl-phosphate reductase
MIKVGIIGATGYAGGELVRILSGHPKAIIKWYGSKSYIGKKYAQVYQNMFQIVEDSCLDDQIECLAKEVDVIFTATPQGYLANILTEKILAQVKVIDLSADYRIQDIATYEKWYGMPHKSPALVKQAVYGLCEINRDKIKTTRLLANPGCYPTCSFFTIYPLLKAGWLDLKSLIIDAKSGVSGAGRGAKTDLLYCEVNESIKAYGVTTHRHTPEIEEQLSLVAKEPLVLNFTPHLVPMNRGILITAYGNLNKDVTEGELREVYHKAYVKEQFVRFLDPAVCPQTKWVEGSNYVDVNVILDQRTNRVIMLGAMDNVVKGAAGAAVQNMNIMFNLPEDMGLRLIPIFP